MSGGLEVVRLPGRVALRGGPVSVVLRPRAATATGLLTVTALALGCVAVSVGDYVLPLLDVLRALAGHGDPGALLVVNTLRLPRVVAGLLVGAAFGLAGALTQAVTRNPLASPDVVGVTPGAAVAAVAVIVLGWPLPLPLAALLGGLATATLVGGLSWRGGLTGPRLLLVGVGLSACATSATTYLLVRADITDAARATVWLTGSLNGRGWEHARPVAAVLPAAVALLLVLGRSLAGLRLGDDLARSLGVRVTGARLGLVVVAVGLAAVATSAAGPVAFVGLVAPQLAVRLAGTPGVPLAASAATGAALVTAADLVARTLLPATELPVGAVTALVGAPVLLLLLRRLTRGVTT